ncbi:MAG: DTW domain-containing protein [Opitutaceae bacterium]
MARSVVLAGTVRCERCQLPPRWCVCAGLGPVESALGVDVLMHHREQWRPSSTGKLIERVVSGSRTHVYQREKPRERADLVRPGRELWILHPLGEPLDRMTLPPAGQVQVLLLDGSWGEAAEMVRAVEPWGRRVSVPMLGKSRYWLREQQGEGKFSTVEALLAILAALGQSKAEAQLRLHFELHVYASLLARGRKWPAAEYLDASPIKTALPDFLRRLIEPRRGAPHVARKARLEAQSETNADDTI